MIKLDPCVSLVVSGTDLNTLRILTLLFPTTTCGVGIMTQPFSLMSLLRHREK